MRSEPAVLIAGAGPTGLTLAWGHEVAAAEQDPHGVTVSFADGGQSRVSWLVGCEGPTARCASGRTSMTLSTDG
jgi:2-polyprenyl-6-methoxyphenol hydroxylase-like FAD-dependent oxidoreductase